MTAKSYTEEEIREIAERQNLVGYPHLALMREKLSVKAKNEPKFRFYNLKRLVVETETLKCAWAQVRANKGAPGVDGVTIEDIEQSEGGAEAFIAGIQKELHEKTYRASPVRRKCIEKANGKLRPLGIPTVKDRVVQCAVKLIIEPIFEADFHDCSFGFRPNRSARQAVDRIAAEIKSGKRQVYDADLSSYFDTIPHDKLFLALRTRITDSGVLSLIRQWLKVQQLSHGKPCAGNPHARFDEGASASEEPRRNALLHNGASMTLRPASGGLKETAFNLGNAGGIADWCGQRDDVSCRWSRCPVGMLAAGFALSPVIAEDAVFAFCIQSEVFDLFEVNRIFYEHGLKIIPPK